jgi:aminoglycoside 3-N-acetyltransferase
MRPNTSMHAVEEHSVPPYLFGPELAYRLRFADGTEREQVYRTHNFNGWIQRYDRMAELLGPDALHTGACLQAIVHFLDTPAMWEAGLAELRRNPLYFVDPA